MSAFHPFRTLVTGLCHLPETFARLGVIGMDWGMRSL